jgi:hypothetical protein
MAGSAISGREVTIAVKRATTWATPVVLGALDGLLVKTNGLVKTVVLLADQPLGTGFETETNAGLNAMTGALGGEARYDGNEWLLLAMAMGAAGAPTQIGAVAAYSHTLQLTPGIAGLFGTLVQKMKSDLVFEWPTVKPGTFTLKGGKKIPTDFSITVVGAGLNQNADGGGGANTPDSLRSVTYRDKRNRMIMDENAYIRVNTQSDGALAASDQLYVAGFELTTTRPIEGDNVLDGTDYITEPVGTGFLSISLKLMFPEFVDGGAALIAAFGANPPTPKKMEIYIRGPVVAGSVHYACLIQIPQAYLAAGIPPIPGPGKIPHELTFQLTEALTAPTGMTSPSVTKPFAITLINARGTDFLA